MGQAFIVMVNANIVYSADVMFTQCESGERLDVDATWVLFPIESKLDFGNY